MVYQNPFRKVRNLTPERVDMGVDYGGTGPVYAVGNGVITSIHNSGWPGGGFIAEHLTAGPDKGKYVFVAEDITPTVRVGQHVHSYTKIGNMIGGIETGWAAAPGTGETMAASAGQASTSGDPGEHPTAYGVNFNQFLKGLGAPGGIVTPPIVGTVPDSFGGGKGGGGDPQTVGLHIPDPTNIPGDIFNALNPVPHILSALGLPSLSDLLERGALIILGVMFLLFGLWRMSGADQLDRQEKKTDDNKDEASPPMPNAGGGESAAPEASAGEAGAAVEAAPELAVAAA